jgi:hypothetical protein
LAGVFHMALHIDGCREHRACGPNGEVARAILDGHCDAVARGKAPGLAPGPAVERVVQGAGTLPEAHLGEAVCTRVVLYVDEPATRVVVAGIQLDQIWQLVSARLIVVAMLVVMVVVVWYAHHLDRARFPERSLVVSSVAQHPVVGGEAPLAHTLALLIVAMLVHMAVRVMVVIVYAHHRATYRRRGAPTRRATSRGKSLLRRGAHARRVGSFALGAGNKSI